MDYGSMSNLEAQKCVGQSASDYTHTHTLGSTVAMKISCAETPNTHLAEKLDPFSFFLFLPLPILYWEVDPSQKNIWE